MKRMDNFGACPIHGLLLANSDAAVELARRMFEARPHLLTSTHGDMDKEYHSTAIFKGEGTILIAGGQPARGLALFDARDGEQAEATGRLYYAGHRPLLPPVAHAPLRRDAARVHGVLRDEARAREGARRRRQASEHRPPERLCEAGRPRHALGGPRRRPPAEPSSGHWRARARFSRTSFYGSKAPEEKSLGVGAAANLARMASAWRLRAKRTGAQACIQTGFSPLHAVTANGLTDMFDWLVELPGLNHDKFMLYRANLNFAHAASSGRTKDSTG